MFAHRVPVLALALCAIATVITGHATAARAQKIDPAKALAAGGPGVFGAMARGQRHFEDVTGDLPNEPITAVAVDPRDADTIFVGLDGFVFRTSDAGETWRVVLSFPRGTAIDDSDEELADTAQAGELGEFAAGAAQAPAPTADDDLPDGDDANSDDDDDDERGADRGADANRDADVDDGTQAALDEEELPEGDVSDDFDATVWAKTTAGARAIVFVPGSPDVVYVATPRGLYRSVDRGISYVRVEVPGGVRNNDIRDVALDPASPSRIYLATAGGMLASRDGGSTFELPIGAGKNVPALCVAVEQLVSTDGNSGVAVLVGTETGLLRSTDGGASFLPVLLRGLPPFFPVPAVAITQRSETFYAGTSRGLFVGERNAALLERYAGVPEVAVQALSPDPIRPRSVVVGTRTRGVWFSNDAGNTVEEGAEQVPAAEVIAIARPSSAVGTKSDQIVVATDRGLFRSVPGTGVTISASALKKLREQWAKEPGLDETARTALEYGRLVNNDLYGMRSRAALSHLLPALTAGFTQTVGRTLRREDFVLRIDDLPPGFDPDNDETDLFGNIGAFIVQPSDGVQSIFFATLVWDLDQVIFNPDEAAVGRAVPAWYAAERRVIERVREAWSARRRLMAEMTLGDAPRGEDAALKHARNLIRLEELTAELDGITGGAFSNPSSNNDP
jgi:hypothetical protein